MSNDNCEIVNCKYLIFQFQVINVIILNNKTIMVNVKWLNKMTVVSGLNCNFIYNKSNCTLFDPRH